MVAYGVNEGRECCCSVTKFCPTFCNPMACSTPGFLVLHHLLEFTQVHVHWISDATKPSYPLSPSSPFHFFFPLILWERALLGLKKMERTEWIRTLGAQPIYNLRTLFTKDRLLENIFQNCVSKTLVFHERARKNTFSLKEKIFSWVFYVHCRKLLDLLQVNYSSFFPLAKLRF